MYKSLLVDNGVLSFEYWWRLSSDSPFDCIVVLYVAFLYRSSVMSGSCKAAQYGVILSLGWEFVHVHEGYWFLAWVSEVIQHTCHVFIMGFTICSDCVMIVVKFLQLNPTRDWELLGYLLVKSWIFSQFPSWIILIAVMELFCYTTDRKSVV